MDYTFVTQYQDEETPCRSFIRLAAETFGISFQPWKDAGYWGECYIPCSLMDTGGNIVSNISVNLMQFDLCGTTRRYIQLGTVMTAKNLRGKGLASRLMDQVLRDWLSKCECLYLFANDKAVGFYKGFGFHPAHETLHDMPFVPAAQTRLHERPAARRLDMGKESERALLLRAYGKGNPYSAFPMVRNPGLLMFYAAGPLSRSVYFIKEYDAVILAEYENGCLFVHDIYTSSPAPLAAVLHALAREDTRRVALGFPPLDAAPFTASILHEEDTTLMLYPGKSHPFDGRPLRFPTLSHA